MSKHSIAIAPFVFGGWQRRQIGDWEYELGMRVVQRGDIHASRLWPREVFPVEVARNQVIAEALKKDIDILFMVDADCGPPEGWFDAALDFLLVHPGPAAVSCPYLGMDGSPMLFKWTTQDYIAPPQQFSLQRQSREEAARARGFQLIADCGCHLIAYKMACFRNVPPPWYSIVTSPDGCRLVAGEDSMCHQKIQRHGAKIYGSFDFWAQHWKEDPRERPLVMERKDIEDIYIQQARAELEHGMAPRRLSEEAGSMQAGRVFEKLMGVDEAAYRKEQARRIRGNHGPVVQRLSEEGNGNGSVPEPGPQPELPGGSPGRGSGGTAEPVEEAPPG